MDARIESILLASTDPAGLRDWYEEVLGLVPNVDGFFDSGVGLLIHERDDVAARAAEPGRVILNHHVRDIHAAAARPTGSGRGGWHRGAPRRRAVVRHPRGPRRQLRAAHPGDPGLLGRRGRPGGPHPRSVRGRRAAVRLPAQDLERARGFYADAFGLQPVEERDGGLKFRAGRTEFVVFASSGRAAGTHTQMGFQVADLDTTVARLRERGVDVPDPVDVEGHYPSSGARGERATWVTDSEGNLLGIGELVYDGVR